MTITKLFSKFSDLVNDLKAYFALKDHTHNNIASRGNVTCETGTTRPSVDGTSMSQVYDNGYPSTYGNVLTLSGSGCNQLLLGWSSTSGGHAPAYIRSKRDVSSASWSDWAQVYTTAHKPTYSDVGAAAASHSHSYLPNKVWIGSGVQDLNTYKTPGIYAVACGSAYTSNYPSGAYTYSALLVMEYNNRNFIQVLFSTSDGNNGQRVFIRHYYHPGTWSSWRQWL